MMNWDNVERLVEEGYIRKVQHATLPLTLFNYTHQCMFENYWTDETTRCRGLIVDDKKNIIANPFPRIFNIEEVEYKYPNEPFKVYEKLDGSLGILCFYQGEFIYATRGSFESEQAKKFQEIFEKKYKNHRLVEPRYEDTTYLFEILYKQNRIVVDYKDTEDCVLLAIRRNDDSEDFLPDPNKVNPSFPPIVRSFEFNSMEEVLKDQELSRPNEEGYVVKFESGLRLKVKFAEYKKLHSILTNTSSISIWEALRTTGSINEFIENVPDEFYDFVKKTKDQLRLQYFELEKKGRFWYTLLMNHCGYCISSDPNIHKLFRKKRAMWIHENVPPFYRPIVFNLLDGKEEYKDLIWKSIRPELIKPFQERE